MANVVLAVMMMQASVFMPVTKDATVRRTGWTRDMLQARTAPTVRLQRALPDWGEGTSNGPGEEESGAAVAPGDATGWDTSFDRKLWDLAGGDPAPAASAEAAAGPAGRYVWGTTSQMVADVHMWFEETQSDFDWLRVGKESDFQTVGRCAARGHPTAANRSTLALEYVAPCQFGLAGDRNHDDRVDFSDSTGRMSPRLKRLSNPTLGSGLHSKITPLSRDDCRGAFASGN